MKRKYVNTTNSPRKKRKYNDSLNLMTAANNNTKMVCVVCLSEMPAVQLQEHYTKYHNELLVSTTVKFKHVIQRCKDSQNKDSNNGGATKNVYRDNQSLRLALQTLRKRKETEKSTNKLKAILHFNVPRFQLNHPITSVGASLMQTKAHKSKTEHQNIMESLIAFENDRHELTNVLSHIPKDINLSESKLLIKALFEQLWNARIICDEQKLFIKYMTQIDSGNRMQISFILNELKQSHASVYNDLRQKLQSNKGFEKWKNMRVNDKKIKDLRENIEKIQKKAKHNNICSIQQQTIENLKKKQSAEIQKYDNSNFFNNSEKKMRFVSAINSVDSINAPTHKAPKPHKVDLTQSIETNDEWVKTIKKLLNEFESSMDLQEITQKLNDLRYCSEFDVLNDMLTVCVNNSQQIKIRFCHYFGNLSEWSFQRLIKWCQSHKYYQICKKIRSQKLSGKQFIGIVTNITSVRRFFNTLTSPQIVQIYNRINHYFEDPLSILV